MHGAVGHEQREADAEVVHEEVLEIDLPLGPEDGLFLLEGKELLDEHEHQRRAQEIEHEEVEAQVGGVIGEVLDGRSRAPEKLGDAEEAEGPRGEVARSPEDDVRQRERPREHHAAEEEVPERRDVVDGAELGGREVRREAHREHRQDREHPERERHDTAQELGRRSLTPRTTR